MARSDEKLNMFLRMVRKSALASLEYERAASLTPVVEDWQKAVTTHADADDWVRAAAAAFMASR